MLVVDDKPTVLMLVVEVLEELGCTAIEAGLVPPVFVPCDRISASTSWWQMRREHCGRR